MVKERWAALSVKDHIDTRSLVPDILMYDRLVVPTCPAEQSEIDRWTARGWDPKVQQKRLEKLGEIAVRVPWDLEHQIIFGTQMDNIKDKSETLNLSQEIPYKLTILILSQEQQSKAGFGVNVLPAYHSIADFEADKFLLEEDQRGDQHINNQRLGLLLRHIIDIPTDVNPENAFDTAVKLAEKDSFKAARRELYAWQEDIISRGFSVEDAARKADELVKQYNDKVREAAS